MKNPIHCTQDIDDYVDGLTEEELRAAYKADLPMIVMSLDQINEEANRRSSELVNNAYADGVSEGAKAAFSDMGQLRQLVRRLLSEEMEQVIANRVMTTISGKLDSEVYGDYGDSIEWNDPYVEAYTKSLIRHVVSSSVRSWSEDVMSNTTISASTVIPDEMIAPTSSTITTGPQQITGVIDVRIAPMVYNYMTQYRGY